MHPHDDQSTTVTSTACTTMRTVKSAQWRIRLAPVKERPRDAKLLPEWYSVRARKENFSISFRQSNNLTPSLSGGGALSPSFFGPVPFPCGKALPCSTPCWWCLTFPFVWCDCVCFDVRERFAFCLSNSINSACLGNGKAPPRESETAALGRRKGCDDSTQKGGERESMDHPTRQEQTQHHPQRRMERAAPAQRRMRKSSTAQKKNG